MCFSFNRKKLLNLERIALSLDNFNIFSASQSNPIANNKYSMRSIFTYKHISFRKFTEKILD